MILLSTGSVFGATEHFIQAEPESIGRSLTISVSKGNCIACHSIPAEKKIVSLANIGPPLIGIKQRFPLRTNLTKQIWDPTQANPNTIMPPFGKHKILTELEIKFIVDYLYTL